MRSLLIFYLFFELLFTFLIGGIIGGGWLFLEFIFSAILGVAILANFHHYMRESIEALRYGSISGSEAFNANILRIIGAFLLIFPGILGDVIGVACELLALRSITRSDENMRESNDTSHRAREKEIIDVEIITKEEAQ